MKNTKRTSGRCCSRRVTLSGRVEYLLELLSYLLRDCPDAKLEIDLEIEKNKELTTYIKGTVERRYKKSA